MWKWGLILVEGRYTEGQENFYVAVAEGQVFNYWGYKHNFTCLNLNLKFSRWQFSLSKCQIMWEILKHD